MNVFANSSLHLQFNVCFNHETQIIMVTLLVIYILMVPLFIFILVMGYQRWREKPAGSSSASNHADIFTYNVVVLELLGVLGASCYCSGTFASQHDLSAAGQVLFIITSPGQTQFHLLTCVERYLAVVHPLTYLTLKQPAGVRIRNIIIGCAWLSSFIVMFVVNWFQVSFIMVNTLLMVFTSITFCVCSLGVMCVLNRPGPGEGGRNGERANQSKQRALHILMGITGSLLLRFLPSLVTNVILNFSKPNAYLICLLGLSSLWFSLPSSLVLPLLFLQRRGKIPDCSCSSDGGA